MKTIKMKIMKTNIRTLAAICVLGFIGTINANAANYRNANNNAVVEEAKNTSVSLVALAEKTSFESDAQFETVNFLLNEDAGAIIDLKREAQLVNKWVVDQAEAKTMKQLTDNDEFVEFEAVQSTLNEVAVIDLRKEAQLATQSVVDQAEAKIFQKLINDGKLAEIN
jgi:hypothetical protein